MDASKRCVYFNRSRSVNECKIHWRSLDRTRVRTVNHDQLAGLKVADNVATSTVYVVHKSQYGETEDRYLRLIACNLYKLRKGSVDGYGEVLVR